MVEGAEEASLVVSTTVDIRVDTRFGLDVDVAGERPDVVLMPNVLSIGSNNELVPMVASGIAVSATSKAAQMTASAWYVAACCQSP